MEEFKTEQRNSVLSSRNKYVVIVAAAAFFFLGILGILSYTPTSDKVFGIENFYEGTTSEATDPKALYDKMFKNVVAESVSCDTTMQEADEPMIAGNNVWLKNGETVQSVKDIKALSIDGKSLQELKPFKSGSRLIVAPAELTFINSNVLQYDRDVIVIRAAIGTEYIIEFEDIASWWCHIGKTEPSKHTEVVGAGGINPKCVEGYIIGEAKKDTIVRLYRVNEQGEELCDFTELYNVKIKK